MLNKIFSRKYPYLKLLIRFFQVEKTVLNMSKKSDEKADKLNKELLTMKKKLSSLEKGYKKEFNTLKDNLDIYDGRVNLLTNALALSDREKVNEKLASTKCKNIVLTTYPTYTTGNVGDAMITDAFVKLIKEHNENFEYVRVFRGESLDKLDMQHVKNIFAPGFSVSPNTYPKNYKLFAETNKLKNFNFVPFGCSYQHFVPQNSSFSKEFYDDNSIEFLKDLSGVAPIPCRDRKITEMLMSMGIDAFYVGDLVLFDPEYINTGYFGNKEIKKVAFTIQHKAKYCEQSKSILTMLRQKFGSDVKIFVTLHGAHSAITKKVIAHAKTLDMEIVELFGESENLSFYDDVDLHVGYRLHGHISVLRRRKPSILLVEDARAFGFSATSETSYGCFQAMDGNKVSEKALEEVQLFLEESLESEFKDYQKVFDFIDTQYNEVIYPYFSKLVVN
ncbi:MAG: hypothetical protein CMO77_09330 [Verrucomicrobiales bacterium]|nr:hypothetical protein [Verrucomicrobiales bacterium]|tara:strand:+ start:2042 stop:3379 length:1338 start_codon:yes stop_codon:yes gene_type:complete